MCGGYTRVCVKCGMCGKVDQRPLVAPGTCVLCGHANDPSLANCSACGAPLPKAPGAPANGEPHPAAAAKTVPIEVRTPNMICKEDVKPIEVGESLSVDEAISPSNSLGGKPEGEGAVEIYCTVCGQPATDGRFTGYGPSMEWWYTITGTLDEIQWVYQTDKNYWDKMVAPLVRCGCGHGTPPCDPMKWSVRQIPAESE